MPYDKQKVIDIALSQVGYHEKASNASLDSNTANSGANNWTKYARDLDALGNFYNGAKNGYAWCDVFVDWCFVEAYGRAAAQELLCQPNGSAGAGCLYSAQYYQNKNQFYKSNPQPGDQIFFGSAGNVYHTGLVIEVAGGFVTTVEGNSSDMVAKRSYGLSDSKIYGYGRPNYGSQSSFSTPTVVVIEQPKPKTQLMCAPKLPVLQEGDESGYVRAAQMMLGEHGYYCGGRTDPRTGKEEFDGEFGPTTKKSLLDFQAKAKLPVTGKVDAATWPKLADL